MVRPVMKGRDLETLVFLGRLKEVKVEYCDEEKKMAKVVGVTDTKEEVETECIPLRAAGKISTVLKHYIRLGVGNYIITESDMSNVANVDTQVEEEENKNEQI
ncbi:conserved hypothetical protein [Sulfolobus islandicus Y.G.57.14]|jgi:hypothetical protein|uniref:Uncharacterized protein n=6 Tax=Saccharolobus TaxID=2100760 RepID=C3MQH2_SACI2|nr:hypothetical protein [Sulfolobus islandicus]ACP35635.1 conserved hypothetical protein [Sulfolobus islandicus L.S.2.15]ACP45789.1 conserved hypothetical protein [Sulfolobus islandicus Y.G.57.14]ACP48404.1 conserved hypothetical protein [Sulfolobus islandicus Y.N.15.51]ADB87392.1 conserved hypothetical protein [Sulfolobus islandicus L.D.8.5]PVU78299.1 hypothetical protein DDW12_03455 [Sulfolobus islandicus]